jgi:hypothetical protein
MSVLGRKSSEISLAPRTVFDLTRIRWGTTLIARSIGRVTAIIMLATGSSPRTAMTAMRGKEVRG